MNAFNVKYMLLLISFLSILGGSIGALLYTVFPGFYFSDYPCILLFFFIIECIFIFVVDTGAGKLSQRALVHLYTSSRVFKVIAALAFLGVYVYVLTDKNEGKIFGLIFLLFYLFSMIFEIYYFSKIEQRLKKGVKDEELF
ncbi:MAG: hypothetical protein FWF54_01180 [Candidatus Azobacteroides sp.]|nr:hypothetical protein [Candidatus Azobacteroides sp.]